MSQIILRSQSEEDTKKIGKVIAKNIKNNTIIGLIGDLAAGKTFLAREIFYQLGYVDTFSSPTFTIINKYTNGEKISYHMDAYRISNLDELNYTGYYDCIKECEVMIIEWADLIKDVLPNNTVLIKLETLNDENPNLRKITITNGFSILKENLIDYSWN